MKFDFFLVFIALLFGSCIDNSELDNIYTFSFPLTIGKSWTYKSSCTYDDSLTDDSTLVYTVITAKKLNQSGFSVYEFRDSSNLDSGWYNYYEQRPNGLYLVDSEAGGTNTLWRTSRSYKNRVRPRI